MTLTKGPDRSAGATDVRTIEAALKTIGTAINTHRFSHNSLFSGRMGRALFNATRASVSPQDRSVLEQQISTDLRSITAFGKYNDDGYANGLSGCLWLLGHFDRKGYLQKRDVLGDSLHRLFFEQAIKQLDAGNYDPLRGAIGHINFLFEDSFLVEPELLVRFIRKLRQKAILDKQGARWRHLPVPGNEVGGAATRISLGVAHGQCGILAFLLKCKAKGLKSRTLDELLLAATSFLVRSIDKSNSVNIPSVIIDGVAQFGRKLAWCYGDLSSAFILLKCAIVLNHTEWKKQALNILKSCAQEDYVERHPMRDACFCHGTAGAAYLFGKLHKETGLGIFKLAAERWIAATLDFSLPERKGGGHTFFDGQHFKPNYGMLEGLTGVGLVLQAHLQAFELDTTDWDSCLYLS